MKVSTILIVLLAILFVRCKSVSNNDVSGIYTNESKSEYSIASDTLIITAINKENKSYLIEHHTGFKRIKNKELQTKQFKQEKWEASWNENTKVLSETDLGRQLTLKPDNVTFVIKDSEFRKIK
jgi:hypothetical protein